MSPFADKKLENDEKLFRRKYGYKIENYELNDNRAIEFTVPYDQVKINEIEVVNCKIGDIVSFYILDSVNGVYQQTLGVPEAYITPYLVLNRFGFDVNMCDGFYRDISSYDADLLGGMIIKIVYINNTGTRNLYFNTIYHQVVPKAVT